mgnify:CR=1 FL=1
MLKMDQLILCLPLRPQSYLHDFSRFSVQFTCSCLLTSIRAKLRGLSFNQTLLNYFYVASKSPLSLMIVIRTSLIKVSLCTLMITLGFRQYGSFKTNRALSVDSMRPDHIYLSYIRGSAQLISLQNVTRELTGGLFINVCVP